MHSPLIGLTPYRFNDRHGHPQVAVGAMYIRSVVQAGGLPVTIPTGLSEAQLEELLGRLDGVLFTGGGDIAPDRYGHTHHPKVDGVDAERDRTEFTLLERVLPQAKPILGICRGFQLINAGLGGTLYEDILDQAPHGLRHQYYPEFPRDMTPHPVQVSEDSRLAQIMERAGAVPVNSLHHQGVEKLAAGLKPTAYAPDGIVEAFEQPEHPFLLAVQWHPEWLPEHDHMQAIFRAFVQAAAR